jgi:hypothetical protein
MKTELKINNFLKTNNMKKIDNLKLVRTGKKSNSINVSENEMLGYESLEIFGTCHLANFKETVYVKAIDNKGKTQKFIALDDLLLDVQNGFLKIDK